MSIKILSFPHIINNKAEQRLFSVLFYFVVMVLVLYGCRGEYANSKEEAAGLASTDTSGVVFRQEVEIYPVKRKPFLIQIHSVGILKAREQSLIQSNVSGKILEMNMREGTKVRQGDLLLKIDDKALQLQKEQAQHELEKAALEKNDLLIRHGGNKGQDDSVSSEVLRSIDIQSGYLQALQNIQKIKYELSQRNIYAPYDGIVANLKTKAHQWLHIGDDICTLINPKSFEVVFSMLEEDALEIYKNQKVLLNPMVQPNKIIEGKVSRINPLVSEQGTLEVYVYLSKHNNLKLFEGMNMQGVFEKSIPNQIVVPKEAIVMREGKEVIFTYNPEKEIALWKDISIAYRNDKYVAIKSDELTEGTLAIIKGNINLAHNSKVSVKNKK